MSTTKARAIVIKEKSIGESNKQLTIFAKDIGKIIVSAKGAKNQKSKFLAGAQVFCYSDFVLYEGNGFLSVTQIDLLRNFSVYYDNIFKLAYGAYFLELIDKTIMFSQESNNILLLLIKSLHILENTISQQAAKKVTSVFQIKLLDLLGVCPPTNTCSLCGLSIEKDDLFFSEVSKASGFVCGNCKDRAAFPVSRSITECINYICEKDLPKQINRVFMFKIHDKVLDELHSIMETIIRNELDITTNSLELLKSF